MASERECGYLTNARMPQVEAGWAAAKRVALRTTYYHLGALRSTRGELMQARGDFRLNENWKAHVVYGAWLLARSTRSRQELFPPIRNQFSHPHRASTLILHLNASDRVKIENSQPIRIS